MKMNREKLYTISEMQKLGVKKCLKFFSEGDENLYNLLKYSYENNLYTMACCKGHKDNKNEVYHPYILYKFNAPVFYKKFLNIVEKMIKNQTPVDVMISNSTRYDTCQKISFSGNEEYPASELFPYLLNELKKDERIVDKSFKNFVLRLMRISEEADVDKFEIDTMVNVDTKNNTLKCRLSLSFDHINKGLTYDERAVIGVYLDRIMHYKRLDENNYCEKTFHFDLSNIDECNQQLNVIIAQISKHNNKLEKLLNKEEEEIA